MALISRGFPTKVTAADLLFIPFNALPAKHPAFGKYLSVLTEEAVGMISPYRNNAAEVEIHLSGIFFMLL